MKVIYLSLLATIVFSSCGHERGGCDGDIIVQNEIPDITLFVGGNPFSKDVLEEPAVFRHTRDDLMTISSRPIGSSTIVRVTTLLNLTTGKPTIVEVTPISEGQTIVQIEANDGCFDRRIFTTFSVSVIDTSMSNKSHQSY